MCIKSIPTVLSGEIPPVVITFSPVTFIFVEDDNFCIPHVLWYGTVAPGFAKEFV